MDLSIKEEHRSNSEQEKRGKSLARYVVSIVLCILFLLVSLDVLSNLISTEEILRSTGFSYLLDSKNGKMPFIVYVLAVLVQLGYLLFGFFVAIVIYTLFFGRVPKMVTIVASGASQLFSFVEKYFIDPLRKTQKQMLLSLVITGLLSFLFSYFHIWTCESVLISGGTLESCPSTGQGFALLLAVYVLVIGFVPAKFFLKQGS